MRLSKLFAKHSLSVAEVHAEHGKGSMIVVDVRDSAERHCGWVPGSRHLPLDELGQRVGELPADATIAFICQSGQRSAAAAAAARAAGRPARSVTGGMTAWRLADLPIERTSA